MPRPSWDGRPTRAQNRARDAANIRALREVIDEMNQNAEHPGNLRGKTIRNAEPKSEYL